MFKTILLPVDFDDSSDAAVEVAVDLAIAVGARILILHAYEAPPQMYAGTLLVPAVQLTADIAKAARAALDAKVQEVLERSPRTVGVAREGQPWRCILEVITEEGCDLVVMGTHGRKAVAHALLGSVAEKIVRLSPVPVLTVRGAPR